MTAKTWTCRWGLHHHNSICVQADTINSQFYWTTFLWVILYICSLLPIPFYILVLIVSQNDSSSSSCTSRKILNYDLYSTIFILISSENLKYKLLGMDFPFFMFMVSCIMNQYQQLSNKMWLYTVYYISVICSTCFGWYLHPSSEAHITILQHLALVRLFLPPSVIMEELELQFQIPHDSTNAYNCILQHLALVRPFLLPSVIMEELELQFKLLHNSGR